MAHAMTLPDWLKSVGWTNRQLADALGVSEECARLYRAARRRPSTAIAMRIFELSNGAVTPIECIVAYYHQRKHRKPSHGKTSVAELATD